MRLIFLLFAVIPLAVNGQADTAVNKKRLYGTAAAVGVAYAGTMVALSNAWYDDFNHQSFRFFNDLPEWKQMDKAGHIYSAYHLTEQGARLLGWSGLNARTSDRAAAVAAMVMLTSVEVFDGYSAGYGASWSDAGFNAAGALLYLGQRRLWNEARIHPKFSFHSTDLAALRPSALGHGASELLKDYNGQSYWLSFDLDKFVKFPAWLNLAAGYGADNMLYARDSQNREVGRQPFRQYYLAFDIDLTGIPTRSRFLKSVFQVVNMIRIPAPAVEFSKSGVRLHPLYY